MNNLQWRGHKQFQDPPVWQGNNISKSILHPFFHFRSDYDGKSIFAKFVKHEKINIIIICKEIIWTEILIIWYFKI
jgi:hypothetical protein